ncbi:phospholipase D-like domain-containing protein [Halorussus lipolyticus]|uniref:phospholipase D-like domain-containing protein n=1 Tax=Halorussus lipolyticus TaxID=3034024 RepID=UPI0023E79F7B|nr:phospholipase D-like domain-containing protein [Halorussus sp. DT80]
MSPPISSSSVVLVAVVLLAVVAPATAPPATATDGNTPTDTPNADATPEIVAVYPNPVADGDSGEFVVVRFPESPTNASHWSLADGESTVSIPNATVSGRVAFSPDPEDARNLTDVTVLGLAGDLSLANGGELLRLVRGNATASTATYEDAPEGERWHRVETRTASADARWRWTPLGATDFGVRHAGPTEARAFVLPDAPAVPLETIREADRRVLLAGYTFSSPRVADALAAAVRRGVSVRVLVDGAPVGGLSRRSAKLLDSLVARGVEVRVVGGPRARYDFHHAKYAVADDRALVMTENWKPSGTGGNASRGWGAVVRSEETADQLAGVFRADAGWRGATPWSAFSRGQSFTPADGAPANGSYPAKIPAENVDVAQSSVIIAPDNAENALVRLLDSADESVRVQQVSIGGKRHSLLRATLGAARREVSVEILLSSAWYVEEDNRKLVEWLNDRAEAENLPLDARMADPRGRYEKIHAKGVVVDGEAAVVGSLNWNNHSARKNREVAVILRGEEVGGFYAGAFDSDWKASAGGPGGGASRLPVGLLGAVAVGAIVALAVAKREVIFEKRR